ncbi:protein transporter Sec31 [Streptomyces sp. NPDC060194]|uniref:protein transporter Sec31 n=1 Tax=Streptomyces sp. NPDC060194 TaxID=3347069 RepID=UPI00365B0F76
MKTRTVRRSRLVPHTVDGRTEMVLDHYDVEAPTPPRDWDRIVLTAVTTIAGLIGAACIVWSTASIGDLLARVVTPPAAYAAAVVFDLAWISCMALEWLARYDQARARLPRRAGFAALAVAMGAVGVHGWLSGWLVIGVVGALVSGLAKGLWTVVLAHHAKPLDDLTQQWVDAQRARAGGELAMVSVRRELARARAAVDAEEETLRRTPDPTPDTPEDEADAPETPELPTVSGPMTIADAVRTALSSGISNPDAVLRYVRKVADANAKEESVRRTLRGARSAS